DDCGVPFHIITFQASDRELCRRIRQRQDDASEATLAVLQHQQQSAQPLSTEEQTDAIAINTEDEHAQETLLENFARYVQ
ncbi:MAG: AAA family ATPase, partial [Methylobacter sp.]